MNENQNKRNLRERENHGGISTSPVCPFVHVLLTENKAKKDKRTHDLQHAIPTQPCVRLFSFYLHRCSREVRGYRCHIPFINTVYTDVAMMHIYIITCTVGSESVLTRMGRKVWSCEVINEFC